MSEAVQSPSDQPARFDIPGMAFARGLIREKPLGAAGAIVFAVFLFCGVLADVLSPYGVNETNMSERLQAPSGDHWFGTDHLGRDVFSRVLIGAQISMIVAFMAAGLATVVSIIIGLLSGYFGGKVDMLIQRVVDAWMTFPDLVLLIVVVSIVIGLLHSLVTHFWI